MGVSHLSFSDEVSKGDPFSKLDSPRKLGRHASVTDSCAPLESSPTFRSAILPSSSSRRRAPGTPSPWKRSRVYSPKRSYSQPDGFAATPSARSEHASLVQRSRRYLLCTVDEQDNVRCVSRGLKIHQADYHFLEDTVRDRILSRKSPGRVESSPKRSGSVSESESGKVSPKSFGARRKNDSDIAHGVSSHQFGSRSSLLSSSRSILMQDEDCEGSTDDEVCIQDVSEERLHLTAGDDQKIENYVQDALLALQQVNCKVLCKPWVKLLEPNKQTKFPYSSNRNKKGDEEEGAPGMPKPYWWPKTIIHREPDHLKKEDRVPLMVHMLLCRGRLKKRHDYLLSLGDDLKSEEKEELASLNHVRSIRTRDFAKVARKEEDSFDCTGAMDVVNEILKALEHLERATFPSDNYEDPSTSFSVPLRKTLESTIKSTKKERKVTSSKKRNPATDEKSSSGSQTPRRSKTPHSDRDKTDFTLASSEREREEAMPPRKRRKQGAIFRRHSEYDRRRSGFASEVDRLSAHQSHRSSNSPHEEEMDRQDYPASYSHLPSSASRPPEYMTIRPPMYPPAPPDVHVPVTFSGLDYGSFSSPCQPESHAIMLTPQSQPSPTPFQQSLAQFKWPEPMQPGNSIFIQQQSMHVPSSPQGHPGTSALDVQSMFVHEPIPAMTSMSMVPEYDPNPPFRNGSIAHPNPRSSDGEEVLGILD